MSYTDSSIIQSGGSLQNFSPGNVESVESDGLIDGIDRKAVEESVKKQIEYDCLVSHPDESVAKMVDEVKDLMVDVLCGERCVVSEGKRVSEETAKAAYRKITFDHVQYVLHSLVNYPDKISRIDRFLDGQCIRYDYSDFAAEIKKTNALIGNATNNINQIAKRVNSTNNIYENDIEELARQLESIWERQREIMKMFMKGTVDKENGIHKNPPDKVNS